MPTYTVIGFWTSTEEADISQRDAPDAPAATLEHFAARRQSDGRLLPDWVYLASVDAAGDPVLANLGADGIGPAPIEQAAGAGAPFLVLGLRVSSSAARLVRLRAARALDAVEAVLADPAGDFQFVCALDAAGTVLHTVENFDRETLARAAARTADPASKPDSSRRGNR